MQGVCFQAVEQIKTLDLPDPEILDSRDAIVRVSMAGLCGSDLHPFFGREQGMDPGTVMGHEMVGEIIALGGAAANHSASLAVGDRVFIPFSTNCGSCFYCQAGLTARCTSGQLFGWVQNGIGLEGCQSSLVRVPLADATLMKLPENLSDEAGLLLGDNFSTGFYCAEMAEVQPGGVYVVVGCGTVGQLCIVAAKSMGAEKIFALDLVDQRLQRAEELGAVALKPDQSALKTIRDQTGGRGADGVMELVGLPAAQEVAYQAVRPGGIMSVIGCHCTPHFAFSPADAYDKNLTYKTGRCSARHYMTALTDRVANGEFDLSGFITHRFAVSDSQRAYDVFSNQKDGCTKAVIEF